MFRSAPLASRAVAIRTLDIGLSPTAHKCEGGQNEPCARTRISLGRTWTDRHRQRGGFATKPSPMHPGSSQHVARRHYGHRSDDPRCGSGKRRYVYRGGRLGLFMTTGDVRARPSVPAFRSASLVRPARAVILGRLASDCTALRRHSSWATRHAPRSPIVWGRADREPTGAGRSRSS